MTKLCAAGGKLHVEYFNHSADEKRKEDLKCGISPLFFKDYEIFSLGKHVPEKAALRYTPLVAARTQPAPNLPEGEAHQLSNNHYCKRDGRREAAPAVVIAENSSSGPKMIAAGSDAKQSGARKGPPTPGKYWEWD